MSLVSVPDVFGEMQKIEDVILRSWVESWVSNFTRGSQVVSFEDLKTCLDEARIWLGDKDSITVFDDFVRRVSDPDTVSILPDAPLPKGSRDSAEACQT